MDVFDRPAEWTCKITLLLTVAQTYLLVLKVSSKLYKLLKRQLQSLTVFSIHATAFIWSS